MKSPGSAVAWRVVHQQPLKTIESIRKSRCRRLALFELVPELTQPTRVIIWQKTEEALRSRSLTLRFINICGYIERESITRVYLNDIMNKKHFHHPWDVGSSRRILGQSHSHSAEMPRMLGAVLEPRPVNQ